MKYKFNWERAAWIAMFVYFGIAAYGAARGPLDDTDPPRSAMWFPERSGMALFTDSGTGCQYVRAGSIFGGALTPRLDASGKPMCGKAGK